MTGQVFTAENLQKAVKTAVQEEDRCKNLMIFGLTEAENEKLNGNCCEVFEEIGFKPSVQCCRVGKFRPESKTRPVKVVFGSATIGASFVTGIETQTLREIPFSFCKSR